MPSIFCFETVMNMFLYKFFFFNYYIVEESKEPPKIFEKLRWLSTPSSILLNIAKVCTVSEHADHSFIIGTGIIVLAFEL